MNITYCVECGSPLAKITDTRYDCPKGHIFWNNAKAATTLIFLKGDKVLTSVHGVKTDPHYGRYGFPGGFVDQGESAWYSAVREGKEELSVDIKEADLELITAYHNHYAPGISTVDLVFIVKKWEGEFTPGDDVASISWEPVSIVYDPRFFTKNYAGLDDLLLQRIQHNS